MGVLAIGLDFANSVPHILSWIYLWGKTTAWIIKIGIVIGGAILYFIGIATETEDEITDKN